MEMVPLEIGKVCRCKNTIMKCANEEDGRLCRVVSVVPPSRWHQPDIPEYRVELLALPVAAFRRGTDLDPIG
jgi:hypothetical protein